MKKLAVAISFILIALIAYEWLSWPDRYSQAMEVVAAEGDSNRNKLDMTDQQTLKHESQDYLTIAKQTLFRADRQGFQQQVDDKSALNTLPALPKIRLLGVILTKNEPNSALIFEEEGKKNRTVHVGDELGRWKIQEIQSGYLLLSWEDQQQKIQLRKY
jgi:type II secretory pathway component PulC